MSKCWCCSLQSGEFIWFSRNCKVRDRGAQWESMPVLGPEKIFSVRVPKVS